ncbi:MAG: Glycosyl transferase family 2 [Candidatus Gottesmanbacteria bacterium GW2011_GWA2_42_18]|uniref:Glycosyl transferase family 2 n=1 Tax=Candidatus Gottesmanbacteria bacterium GW2011_GWA2_42_18 TaxID=1618442 RepID=A0A0G0ZFG2_9BACT|nr:MAG: Glycosyl transferase family 2 [Candidatus Gottesmanbacteria bacterium GW2011_GWA2_42_18]
MSKNKITVHTIVKNDDRFIWYSLSSILPYADEVFVCDTGSTDQTYKIIKTFDNPKIILESKKSQNREDITRLRQEQLKNTQGGFIWLVDGDEIYPRTTAQEIRELVDRQGSILINCRAFIFREPILWRDITTDLIRRSFIMILLNMFLQMDFFSTLRI